MAANAWSGAGVLELIWQRPKKRPFSPDQVRDEREKIEDQHGMCDQVPSADGAIQGGEDKTQTLTGA